MGDEGEQIEALLIGEAGDDADQGPVQLRGKTHCLKKMALAFGLAAQIVGGKMGRNKRIGFGTPFRIIDSVQNAAELIVARPKQTVEAEAILGGLNFASVSGTYGGDGIGKNDAAFQEADHAIKFKGFCMIENRIEADFLHPKSPEIFLVAQIVDGQDAF